MTQTARQRAVMARVRAAQQKGYTGYSVALRRKVKVSPKDRIEVKTTKLKNGNTSVMVIGHTPYGKVPRTIGQYKC